MFEHIDASFVLALPLVVGWFVKSGPIGEGHEALTRAAARGLSSADMATLIKGVRSPDVDGPLTNHIKLSEQRRHCLKRVITQSTNAALKDATAQLRKLHGRVLGASSKSTRLHSTGEALHLIQDSFSPAHTERKGRTIKKLRNYGPTNLALGPFMMSEHVFPIDGRDGVKHRGKLTREANLAIDASREYFSLVTKHTGPNKPTRQEAMAELEQFIGRWFKT